jgi:hypothetical protein
VLGGGLVHDAREAYCVDAKRTATEFENSKKKDLSRTTRMVGARRRGGEKKMGDGQEQDRGAVG